MFNYLHLGQFNCQHRHGQSIMVSKKHVDSVHLGLRYSCNLCKKQYRDMGPKKKKIKSKQIIFHYIFLNAFTTIERAIQTIKFK